MYKWLSRNKYMIGEGGAVNRMRDWRSKLRSKMNKLAMCTKGSANSVGMLKYLLAIALEECLNQSLKSISAAG